MNGPRDLKYTFLHKRHKEQPIAPDPKWTDLLFVAAGVTRKRFYCDRDGTLESVLYLPLEFELLSPAPATVRVRLVREAMGKLPMDPTGYDERTLLPGGDGFARIRFAYQGEAQEGRRYFWQAQTLGQVRAVATGTHYAQFTRT